MSPCLLGCPALGLLSSARLSWLTDRLVRVASLSVVLQLSAGDTEVLLGWQDTASTMATVY